MQARSEFIVGNEFEIQFSNKEVLSRKSEKEKSLWKLFFENIEVIAKIKWYKHKENAFAIRDAQMFKNIDQYLTNYPNEKCVVWAANGHIIRNDDELKGDRTAWSGIKKLGDHIHEKYGTKSYSIGVTAYQGKTADWFDEESEFVNIKSLGRNSLEYKLQNFEHLFVNLKLLESKLKLKKYKSQLLYTNAICNSTWSNNFDGVIYIKTMAPSTKTETK